MDLAPPAWEINDTTACDHARAAKYFRIGLILVQGPAQKLLAIADKMITQRGVTSGRMQVVAALIPPVHPFIASN